MIDNITQAYIAGAASRAKTLKGYLEELYPQIKIKAFLVDNMEENEPEIDGIPVRIRHSVGEEAENTTSDSAVFIATKGIHHAAITEELRQMGFSKIFPVTVELDNSLRNAYAEKYFADQGREWLRLEEVLTKDPYADGMTGDHIQDIHRTELCGDSAGQVKNPTDIHTFRIYMAKSIYDKPLQTRVAIPSYMQPIQVGAALTEERLEEGILTDCSGVHISEKNRQYSELTALYWIWKQAREDVVGLCHYRRHFVLPEDWFRAFSECEVDVILPVPTFVLPNIEENYRERHDASDWEFLMKLLQERMPEEYGTVKEVFGGKLYSPCNMFIARREIVEELCTWMFPLLFEVEQNGGMKTDVYQNRYPGFVSERLITLFFHLRSNRYRMVYADKTFYQ